MNSIGIYTCIQFEDLWFYWNGYPFELFIVNQDGSANGESPVSLYFTFMYM